MNSLRFILSGDKRYRCFGLTLAELIIAAGLLIIIVLGAASLDFAARKFYSRTEKGAAALQDVSLAMEYLQRSGEQSIGDMTSGNAAYESDATGTAFCAGYSAGCRFVIDFNQNGIREDPTTTDTYNTFCYSAANHTLTYLENGEVIARRLVYFAEDGTTVPGVVFLRLGSRDNPSVVASADNPNVYLEARVFLRSASQR
ncbi:MAG: hypothetical protein PHI86_02970 [Candidatus Omnitrophica bacterium]|nr:hypothetical protein [Candidatus Omnitrophota bacterium]HOX54757.1 hypothetical protein [Candidatus Omnitrophota bacterium]